MTTSNPARGPGREAKSVETARDWWREMYGAMAEVQRAPHPEANTLSYFRDRMVWADTQLLKRGMDISSRRNPRKVPIPLARHPKIAAEIRKFEADILALLQMHDLYPRLSTVGKWF